MKKFRKPLCVLFCIIWAPFVILHELLHYIFILPLLLSPAKKVTTKPFNKNVVLSMKKGEIGFQITIKEDHYNILEVCCLFIAGIAPIFALIPLSLILYQIDSHSLLWDYFAIGMITCIPSRQDFKYIKILDEGFKRRRNEETKEDD